MEFKTVKERLEYLKFLKYKKEISETGENELKELELLLEQREKMLEMLIKYNSIIKAKELENLIKEATEI
jgi:hypothetical protein